MNTINADKLREILKTPRYVEDGRYDNLSLDYVKYSDVLTLSQLGLIIGIIIFAILGFLGWFGLTFTPVFVMVGLYLLIYLFKKFYLNAENEKLSREAAKTADATLLAVVQASDLYGVVVFAKNGSPVQSDAQSLHEIADHLRSIGDGDSSEDPAITHVQERLHDTSNYFDAEPLAPEVVGGHQNIWWKVESISSAMPKGFDPDEDVLLGFIKEDSSGTYLSLVDKAFYGKYLV